MANHARTCVSLRHSLRIRMAILATCAVMLVGAAFLLIVVRPLAEKIAEHQFDDAAFVNNAAFHCIQLAGFIDGVGKSEVVGGNF